MALCWFRGCNRSACPDRRTSAVIAEQLFRGTADRAWQTPSPPPIPWKTFLRRLPLAIRQFRQRWGTRQPFRVEDEHDLEDVVRSLLPLFFDDVRLRSRTPSYAPDTRTDFLLFQEKILLTIKQTTLDRQQSCLENQLEEDKSFYRNAPDCGTLWLYVYDPQAYLQDPHLLEAIWSQGEEGLQIKCVIS